MAISSDEGRSFDYMLTGPYETTNAFLTRDDEFVVFTYGPSERSDGAAGVYRWIPGSQTKSMLIQRNSLLLILIAIMLAAVFLLPFALLQRPLGTGVQVLTASVEDSDTNEDWQPPRPPAAAERVGEREKMVRHQIEKPRGFRTAVKNDKVLDAMRAVPRHVFVPVDRQRLAYRDTPLPIGFGQTISQPYIVALMTEQLRLTPKSKVLEIGTGSGYQASVLAHLTPHIYSIEIVEKLAERTKKVLEEEGYGAVKLRRGDGYFGWEEAAPFDAIIVTCAAGHLPPALWKQLKPGGRIVAPIGGSGSQRLLVFIKTREGRRRTKSITGVRFVPMTGRMRGE